MDNFTRDNPEMEDYKTRGGELAKLIVQAAFVEGIVPEEKSFDEVADAFRFVFRNNREYGIILWNGVPVRFSYTEDFPLMVEPLADLLEFVLEETPGEYHVRFQAPGFELEWNVSLRDNGILQLQQQCGRISGNYEEMLNRLGMISLTCEAFLKEWKLPLAQLVEAFERSAVTMRSVHGNGVIRQLKLLDESIPERGTLYQY